MSNGYGALIVCVLGGASLWAGWHYNDIGAAYEKQTPRELSLIGTGIESKATEKGKLTYLVGNFVEKDTKRNFQYPITQQTFDQFAETASTLHQPIMGRPYVPRQPLLMEMNLAEKDIQPDKDKDGATGKSYLFFTLSFLLFLMLM